MPIPVSCSGCSARFNAPDAVGGKRVKCPKCQAPINVPAPMPQFEVVEEEEPEADTPAGSKSAARVKAEVTEDDKPRKKLARAEVEEEDETPRKKKNRAVADDDDEEDERPKKKKKRQQAPAGSVFTPRNIIMACVLVVLVGVAGTIFYVKFGKDESVAQKPNPAPEPTPNNPDPAPKPKDKQPPVTPPKKEPPKPRSAPTELSALTGVKFATYSPDGQQLATVQDQVVNGPAHRTLQI